MDKTSDTLLLTCRLVEFLDSRIDEVSVDFYHYLVVTGIKPYANMDIQLIPRVYVDRPDYWAIEVVGTLRRYALPAVTPFEVTLTLDWPAGSKGIRVVGANGLNKLIDWTFVAASNPDDGGKRVILERDRPKR